MYVVRIDPTDTEPLFRIFRALPDARALFDAAAAWMPEKYASVALFEVTDIDDDPHAARERARSGQAVLLAYRNYQQEREQKRKDMVAMLEELGLL